VKYQYFAVKQNNHTPELGTYLCYAIEARDAQGSVIDRLDDFTVDRREAETFAEIITRLQLDPLHLRDAAYDALIENSSI